MLARLIRLFHLCQKVFDPVIKLELTAVLVGFLHQALFYLAGLAQTSVQSSAEILLVKGIEFMEAVESTAASTKLGQDHARLVEVPHQLFNGRELKRREAQAVFEGGDHQDLRLRPDGQTTLQRWVLVRHNQTVFAEFIMNRINQVFDVRCELLHDWNGFDDRLLTLNSLLSK